jgi:hypothetical protein
VARDDRSSRPVDAARYVSIIVFSLMAAGIASLLIFRESSLGDRVWLLAILIFVVAAVVMQAFGTGRRIAAVEARPGEPFRFEFRVRGGKHSLWLDYVWTGPQPELGGDDADQVPSAEFRLRISVAGSARAPEASYRGGAERVLLEGLVTPGSSALAASTSGSDPRTVSGTKPIHELPPLPADTTVTVEGVFPREAWSHYATLMLRATRGALIAASTAPRVRPLPE